MVLITAAETHVAFFRPYAAEAAHENKEKGDVAMSAKGGPSEYDTASGGSCTKQSLLNNGIRRAMNDIEACLPLLPHCRQSTGFLSIECVSVTSI